jgi:hypothetical protein
MFVRWQTYKPQDSMVPRRRYGESPRLSAILLESVRVDGKPRHRHIAFLGSLDLFPADHHDAEHNPSRAIGFWRRVMRRLDKLHNRITSAERESIVAAIAKKIGHQPPTEAEMEKHKRAGEEWRAGFVEAFGDKSEGPQRERRKKIFDARQHGKVCAKCDHAFASDEEVYRLRLHIGLGLMRGHRHCTAPVCHECFESYVKEWWGWGKSFDLYSVGKCENCSRTVQETQRQRRRHRYYCCEDCRQKHAPRFYAEKRRARERASK